MELMPNNKNGILRVCNIYLQLTEQRAEGEGNATTILGRYTFPVKYYKNGQKYYFCSSKVITKIIYSYNYICIIIKVCCIF